MLLRWFWFIRPKTDNVAQPNAPIVGVVQSAPTPTTIKDHFLKVGLSEAVASAAAGMYGQPTTYTRSPKCVRDAQMKARETFRQNQRSEAEMKEMEDIIALSNNSEINRRLAKLIPTFSYKYYINSRKPSINSTLELPGHPVKYVVNQPDVVYSENHGGGAFNLPIYPWNEPIANIAKQCKSTRKKQSKQWAHVRK